MTSKTAEWVDRAGAKRLFSGVRRWARQFSPNGYIQVEEIQNRRAFERKPVATPINLVEITENNAPGRSLPASVINVSKKGMCVLVDEPLSKGSLVMLDLTGRSKQTGRSILAHVTRIQRPSGQAGYLLGLRTETG